MVKETCLIIDGGTSNTRIHVVAEGQIIESFKFEIGASTGNKDKLLSAINEVIINQKSKNIKLAKIFASGMLTSKNGIKYVEHLSPEVPLNEIGNKIVPDYIEGTIDNLQYYFIPGYKLKNYNITLCDVIKGEETEIFGYIDNKKHNYTFIHFGSHSKIISVNDFYIKNSITTISGELFFNLIKNTIISGSLNLDDISNCKLNTEALMKGAESLCSTGFSRSIFIARLNDIIAGKDKNYIASFILGTILFDDYIAFKSAIKSDSEKIILYGREIFTQAFNEILKVENPELTPKVKILSHQESEKLSIKGLIKFSNYVMEDKHEF